MSADACSQVGSSPCALNPLLATIWTYLKGGQEMAHMKTAFLILLGSGCRRSEFYALNRKSSQHDKDWTWVLSQSLDDNGDPQKLKLCPVWALQWHLAKMDKVRGSVRRLLLPFKPGKTQGHPNTVSSWINGLIEYSYEHATNKDFQLLQLPQIPRTSTEPHMRSGLGPPVWPGLLVTSVSIPLCRAASGNTTQFLLTTTWGTCLWTV